MGTVNVALRSKIYALVADGNSLPKIAKRLKRSREDIRQICGRMYGRGVISKHNRIDGAAAILRRVLKDAAAVKSGCIEWVAKEAVRRGLRVFLCLNPKRRSSHIVVINGWRVLVCVSKRPYDGYVKGKRLYHWGILPKRKKHPMIDVFILLAVSNGFVRHVIIMPEREIGCDVYFPEGGVYQRENNYPLRFVDGWDFLAVPRPGSI